MSITSFITAISREKGSRVNAGKVDHTFPRPGECAMAELKLDTVELRSLLQSVLAEVLAELEQKRLLLNGRLAVTEPEAAAMLGLHPWQLRDLRLAGKIGYSRIVGDRIRYNVDDLDDYLKHNHVSREGDKGKLNSRR